MNVGLAITPGTHVIDILGNVIGRDQPIMLMSKAVELVSCLDEDILTDDEVVFFDPFCKAGEILLACALVRCLAKVNKNKKMIEVKVIQEELYKSNRYFALAPDERHHKLSLRTFLGNTNSHDEKLTRIIRDGHYLSEIDGRLDKEKFEKEFNDMLEYITTTSSKKKIVVVGNPPYQEADGGGGKSAKPIYHLFVDSLILSKDIYAFLMVIPARWFIGGKGLDKFRLDIISSNHVKTIRNFTNSREVFPTVDVNGGICFLHYDKNYQGEVTFLDGSDERKFNLSEHDIISDDINCYDIIDKITKSWKGPWLSDIAWSRNPFGLVSDYFKNNSELNLNNINAIPCLTIKKEVKYANINHVTKNNDKINLYKVCVSKAAGGSKGKRRSTIPKNLIFIVPNGTITTETYSVINTFQTKQAAENMVKYLQTDFVRYLVGLRKITQNISRNCWKWVPMIDINKQWTDEELFKYFNLIKKDQFHIIKKVKEWS